MKKTAVKWLMNEIENRIVRRNPHNTIIIQTQVDTFNELFEQAKDMEKEQIMNAWMHGFEEIQPYIDSSEDYYNKTFKSE